MSTSELGQLGLLMQRYYAHDVEGRRHATGVARISFELGRALRLPRSELVPLAMGALLHDVGKLVVPASLLESPRRLTEDEWAIVQTHSAAGESLVSGYLRHPLVRAIVRWHHERLDGQGYPDGLKGEQIPLVARIVAVADAYDAMVADRPYSPARTPQEAFEEAFACAGRQLDARCVAPLREIVRHAHRAAA
jgi:HD-GYP domain-containing protein (c-di-GMP phosphodiesterase class II)